MIQSTGADTERKIIAILKVLSESSEPIGSITIARKLEDQGIYLSERAVRYHLKVSDERGYTLPLGRDGRQLSAKGLEELRIARAPDRLSFIQEKLELLAFRTTFNPDSKEGFVPINTSIFDKDEFPRALKIIKSVVKAGMCVSEFVVIANEGQKLGDVVIPEGKIGMGTICGVTINGVLLKNGVPMESKFGGILEIRNSKPLRFTAIINYGGTSLDPSEQYIRARMTSVGDSIKTGNGRILANFREIPALSKPVVEDVISKLKLAGINGILHVGGISEPVCQLAVGTNRVGIILIGGLNPVAATVEAGFEVDNMAESGIIEFNRLTSIWKV
jgi:HTH-type transcriptional regulator, global nitrogen regulator NrpRI